MAGDENGDEADDRTEEPSQKRLSKAWQEGQVALSREAVGFAALIVSAGVVALVLPGQIRSVTGAMRGSFSRAHEMEPGRAATEWLVLFLIYLWPIAAAAILGAVIATFAQTRGAITVKQFAPKLSKLSPATGLQRLFGKEALVEFLKTVIKLCTVATAMWFVAADLPGLAGMLEAPLSEIVAVAGRGVARLLLATLAAFAVIAVLDVMLTHQRHRERLRMSRRDLKEEAKESEGDPQIKGRMRQLRETLGRRRMLAAVPRATVVITNPTHYAVALSYDAGQAAAPRLVAKGVDAMATRIREAAQQAGVPIVPDPPLARALHRLEVEAEIPNQYWEAVAKIIAYVMRLRGRADG